jgi:hypothetical protein
MAIVDFSANARTAFIALGFLATSFIDPTSNISTQFFSSGDLEYRDSLSAIADTEALATGRLTEILGLQASAPTLFRASGLIAAAKYYLNRPVYTLDRNWANAIQKKFAYNLRDKLLGLALPRYEQLQSATIQGIDFSALLETSAKITQFDQFTELLRGRLNGFWMPSPFETFEVIGGLSATSFEIKEQGLTSYFLDHPSTHLVFSLPGHVDQYAEIQNVQLSVIGTGRETVTLTAPMSPVIDQTWICAKLLYVRMSDDLEQGSFEADNVQVRQFSVVELPTEYAQIETGLMPVYLYEYYFDAGDDRQYFRFTGLNSDFVAFGNTFATFPIEHSGLRYSMTADRPDVQVKSWWDAANPLTYFIPFALPFPLWLTIYETTYDQPNAAQVIFYGRVDTVTAEGKMLTAKCSGFLESINRKFPRFLIQPRCNYAVYDANCQVKKEDFGCEVNLYRVDGSGSLGQPIPGRPIKVASQGGPTEGRFNGALFNKFSQGFLVTGFGPTREIRSIKQSTAQDAGVIFLRLSMPLNHAVIGQPASIYPGCDGHIVSCKGFNNFRRFGGHVTPLNNPSLKAITPNDASGNKK